MIARHWLHQGQLQFHTFLYKASHQLIRPRSFYLPLRRFITMPKRKSTQSEQLAVKEVAPATEPSRRRSTRLSLGQNQNHQDAPEKVATSTPLSAKAATPKTTTRTTTPSKTEAKTNGTVNGKKRKPAPKVVDESEEVEEDSEEPKNSEPEEADEAESPEPPTKKSRTSGRTQKSKKEAVEETNAEAKPVKNQPKAKASTTNGTRDSKKNLKVEKQDVTSNTSDITSENTSSERNYWLLKAEPETRLENGTDVKFSIDDLASKTEPEPWDGIRNYVARNNLRAMKKGDLAFFYHSNCKEPGIVGTMEIVQEHSPDLSAHDPKAPYYDAKSKPSDPKWSVVHVEFRSKFAEPIGLKELRSMGDAPGKPLANMQMLKQSRLSVSKVSKEEWEYLIGVAEERGKIITKK